MATRTKYRVVTNTGGALNTNIKHEAEREWARVRPTDEAGSKYHAQFLARCSNCGEYSDTQLPYATCACADQEE